MPKTRFCVPIDLCVTVEGLNDEAIKNLRTALEFINGSGVGDIFCGLAVEDPRIYDPCDAPDVIGEKHD